eukprot:TRINITY_DN110986_c0_g1_i1.p1 TRINITY_DN110986_c0_g1~~TRINITY_DN110986_c0_g1_i1.p1  ORF type:complete len:159 (-),score=23.63 TRINITY_DN110986_c0_g1_i1:45-521(-)
MAVRRTSRVTLALVASTLASALCWLQRSEAFVNGAPTTHRASTHLRSNVAMLAESGKSSIELPVYEEGGENSKSASIVFLFIFGLVAPVLHSFNFGLILAAIGWGLSNGKISDFAKKQKALTEYATYVDQAAEVSEQAGTYSLKAYNFLARKAKELSA